ncbi:DUF6894 family protein [Sinorhizobium terangae]|uniref:DUF6894 domain-containing protein n=1 Tax=Sinorhizobium terangae TaxID=110322 RepID=A0A6N7LHL8_SINTE|nr:hypothetical protein [Sinorhizobium terangae]MBB4187386.1 hypothetical protein [Sinorhizobium terangae]MQX17106.1 hypothetical protein [Sinorhizobium terangae]WFU49085.1 hypothetical protein QA637_06705 [Sinorhizobium terangae]
MQLYFFDLRWGDERFVDDEGIAHFDEGSALYYAQRIADKIGRDAGYGSLKVEVRSKRGTLLATVVPSVGRGRERLALVGRRYPGLFRNPADGAPGPATVPMSPL